jgi:hypothetical protein
MQKARHGRATTSEWEIYGVVGSYPAKFKKVGGTTKI